MNANARQMKRDFKGYYESQPLAVAQQFVTSNTWFVFQKNTHFTLTNTMVIRNQEYSSKSRYTI
jgi:hypothetical protein